MKACGVPCCFYPTTVLFVDDDEDFLRVLQRSIDSPNHIFHSPFKAITYLEQARFTMLKNERNRIVDISAIHQHIHDPKRYEDISVVVVDYQMPGMNGLEFCKRIKDYNLKIIMLTGEAGLELAIEAFNHGIIDKFIRKNSVDLYKELPQAITEMQFKHFQEASRFFVENLDNRDSPALPDFLQNEKFVVFFNKLLQQNHIREYYLLDHYGHFLMRNQNGEFIYFMVQDEVLSQEFIRDAEAKYKEEPCEEGEEILMRIKNKQAMPFLYHLADIAHFNTWHQYMHPLQSEICDGVQYHYAFIKNDPYDRGIDLPL